MAGQKIILQKLAFSKYLIYKGNIESSDPEPVSSASILNYRDAFNFSKSFLTA